MEVATSGSIIRLASLNLACSSSIIFWNSSNSLPASEKFSSRKLSAFNVISFSGSSGVAGAEPGFSALEMELLFLEPILLIS
jgi:hypothetical protein